MPFINGNVKVEELDHGRWKLLEGLRYQGERDLFEVPAGFVTDFASVPGLFTWLGPAVWPIHQGGHLARLSVR